MLEQYVATSGSMWARLARTGYRAITSATLPVPRAIIVPMAMAHRVLRSSWHFGWRILVCEPLFKGYCHSYGRRVRTGVFVHWVQGSGDIVIGNNVVIDGKCSFLFAARFSDRPRLEIGDGTGVGHNCSFTIGKKISIGQDCRIAGDVSMFDSAGHPSDPIARRSGHAPDPVEVKPITIGDNVWVGRGATIFPGVSIGDDSVVAAASVVMSSVPAGVLVGGNPARLVRSLKLVEEVKGVSR